jgi:hypothetical protein
MTCQQQLLQCLPDVQYAAFQWLEDRKRWQARVPMRDGANGPLFIWNPLTNSYEDKI